MLCGSAAMEAILSIARTTTIRFKMPGAINSNGFLPFPTPAEAVDLHGAYNMSANRGYLAQQQYAYLAEGMQVPASDVKQWFNKERRRMGHQGNYHKYQSHPKRRGQRTKLPLSRGKAPLATNIDEVPSATHAPETKSEYFKEDTPRRSRWMSSGQITLSP